MRSDPEFSEGGLRVFSHGWVRQSRNRCNLWSRSHLSGFDGSYELRCAPHEYPGAPPLSRRSARWDGKQSCSRLPTWIANSLRRGADGGWRRSLGCEMNVSGSGQKRADYRNHMGGGCRNDWSARRRHIISPVERLSQLASV